MTSTTQTASEFLMGGGVISAKFPTVGTTVGGPITRVGEPQQQRDFDSGQPKFWDNGEPMMQLPVEVATELPQESPEDDGVRCFYIKGLMLKAVREAIRNAGAKGLEVGGHLAVTYARDGEPKRRGFNPPKEYTAVYTPPTAQSAQSANGFLAGGIPNPTPATAAPATTQPPVQAPTAQAPAAGGRTPEQRAALLAAGLDPDTLQPVAASATGPQGQPQADQPPF